MSGKTRNNSRKRERVDRWNMPRTLLSIVDEHKYVARLLPVLQAEADKLKQNRRPDYDCMEDILHYMVNFPDRYHHPKEDLIFDRMHDVEPATTETVARLRDDHKKMAGQGKTLQESILAQKQSRRKVEARRLGEEVSSYVRHMRQHMRLEESTVLKPARDTLSESDWKKIDEAIDRVDDPIFGHTISERYLSLMQRYVNEFVSVSSSGTFPIRLVESTLGRVEQGMHTVAGMRHLPKLLLSSSREIRKARLSRLRDLASVRDCTSLRTWHRKALAASRDDWSRLAEQVREITGSAGGSVDAEDIQSGVDTITLRTEKELLSYQEKPYTPSSNPRTSWQAALMNLVGRIALKPGLSRMDLDDTRGSKLFRREASIVPSGTRIEVLEEPDFHGAWIVPDTEPETRRVILHLPGGGFFSPATDMHRVMLGRLAGSTRTRALLVNYRLLPEHPFPAGLEDALSAYRHLLANGYRPGEIVVSGDSAGGNIALAMLLAARDEGLPMPAACALISPCTDLTFSTAARERNRWIDPMLPDISKKDNHLRYAGDYPLEHPLISPIYANFAGLPPMFAFVSSTETLLDDTLVVARKARAQGVDFEVEIWQSLPHAWPLFSFLPEARAALERLSGYFEEHLNNAHIREAAETFGD